MDCPIRCLGCRLVACSGTCLATHRTQYACHNPRCIYHRPCPPFIYEPDSDGEPAPGPQKAAAPVEPNNTVESQGEDTGTSDVASAEASASPNNSADNQSLDDVVYYRETVTREYRLINGQVVQLPQHHPAHNTNAGFTGGSTSATATTTNNNDVHLDVLLRQIQLHERRLEELERGRQSSRPSSSQATQRTSSAQQSPCGSQGSPCPSDGSQS